MTLLQRISVVIGLVACYLPVAQGSPYIISDDRIRSLDVTPVLGRGYSVMTNSFQSICIKVNAVTVPSYNYEYSFHDLTDSSTSNKVSERSFKRTYGYSWWKGTVNTDSSSNTTKTSSSRTIIATMRIERYYSSLREDKSSLTDDATTLLDRQDYIGFFKGCGSTYVRGIRRAQEVAVVFSFESTSTETAKEFARTVKGTHNHRRGQHVYGYTRNTSSKFNSINKSLTISIRGFGLGLGVEGSETLIATSMEEYASVMKFAFRTMTQGSDNNSIGMVYGVEVIPWVDNTAFQVVSGLTEEIIELPMPRSLIPKAFKISDPTDTSGYVNLPANDTSGNRDDYTCKESVFVKDKYGYCCEANHLFDVDSGEFNSTSPEKQVCRPTRVLNQNTIKNNMAANGEFIARLDRVARYKLNHMFTLEQCISATRAFPSRFDFYVLKAVDTVNYDKDEDPEITLFDLKLALDPFNDYGLLKQVGKELDEFTAMYYAPCLAALFGANSGTTSDSDPSLFMAYPWYSHEECLHLSCLSRNMRWDRVHGGCVQGILAGGDAADYQTITDEKCAYDEDKGGDTEECKHLTSELSQTQTNLKNCWGNGITQGYGIDFLMEQFCMPELSSEQGVNLELVVLGATENTCELKKETYSKEFNLLNPETEKIMVPHEGDNCRDQTTMILWNSVPGVAQTFKYHFEHKVILNVKCDKVLDMSNNSCDGTTKIKLSDYVADSATQQFEFKRDGTIRPISCQDKAISLDKRKYLGANIVISDIVYNQWDMQWRAEYLS